MEEEVKKRTECMVCDEKIGEPIIKLKDYPITETYVKREVHSPDWVEDQSFQYCGNCGHGQLENVLPQKRLYDSQAYKFRTSQSIWGATKGNDVFLKFINESIKDKKFKRIIEIGCNDAYLLENLKGRAEELIGVDPVLESEERDGIKLIGDFYENTDLRTEDSLVITHQVLEHLENPKGLLKEIMKTSNENTTCVFGFPSLDYLVDDSRFDQIFHHHLNYFSKNSSLRLLDEVGANCFNVGWNSHYWGTIMLAFKPSQKRNLETDKINVSEIQESFSLFKEHMAHLSSFIEKSKRDLYCYGAGLQLPVLNYYVPSINQKSKGIIDDDSSKDGLIYPNLKPKIISGQKVDLKDKDIIITAINFSRGILQNIVKKDPHRIYNPFNSLP